MRLSVVEGQVEPAAGARGADGGGWRGRSGEARWRPATRVGGQGGGTWPTVGDGGHRRAAEAQEGGEVWGSRGRRGAGE
ncbi:hypothetical protein GUJ93_ZPchr0002g25801 [Zizania palustris]|uniref:Uncharacterized protein n=1 Tax=Zizania palustris TaxID=103762 RepID=A0A8J5VUG7_ZIZPA|nr:hypothetical protein GUJ93_ZPchr0002g25801 [Zizania palustris]